MPIWWGLSWHTRCQRCERTKQPSLGIRHYTALAFLLLSAQVAAANALLPQSPGGWKHPASPAPPTQYKVQSCHSRPTISSGKRGMAQETRLWKTTHKLAREWRRDKNQQGNGWRRAADFKTPTKEERISSVLFLLCPTGDPSPLQALLPNSILNLSKLFLRLFSELVLYAVLLQRSALLPALLPCYDAHTHVK